MRSFITVVTFLLLFCSCCYGDDFDEAISLLTVKHKNRTQMWIYNSARYIDMIQSIFQRENLPLELSYLPLIESGYNPFAVSSAGAVGMWQFMEETAKRYGLKVNNCVDERLDPELSTEAAARYLKDLFDLFGSWELALMAYNAGENRFTKKVSYSLFSSLPRETRFYLPLFYSAVDIMQNPDKYGFKTLKIGDFSKVKKIAVKGDLKKIAKKYAIKLKVLKALNTSLLCDKLPFSYMIRIPEQ